MDTTAWAHGSPCLCPRSGATRFLPNVEFAAAWWCVGSTEELWRNPWKLAPRCMPREIYNRRDWLSRFRGPKDHTKRRILHSGSKAQSTGNFRKHCICGILMLTTWFVEPLESSTLTCASRHPHYHLLEPTRPLEPLRWALEALLYIYCNHSLAQRPPSRLSPLAQHICRPVAETLRSGSFAEYPELRKVLCLRNLP